MDVAKPPSHHRAQRQVALDSDRRLFARLLVLAKHTNIDLKEILRHSLGAVSYPLASTFGGLAKTDKASLLHHLKTMSKEHIVECVPKDNALIIDFMAMLHALPTVLPATFNALADFLFTRILNLGKVHGSRRIDVVCDTYPLMNIKEHKFNIPGALRAAHKSATQS